MFIRVRFFTYIYIQGPDPFFFLTINILNEMTIYQESFIELNRTFYQLSSDYTQSSHTDDIDIRESLRLGIGDTFGWDALLKEYRVILLAEAGFGQNNGNPSNSLKASL